MTHVTLDKPLTLEIWQEIMQETFPGAKFWDYGAVFEVPQPCTIAARLKEILEEFKTIGQGRRIFHLGTRCRGFLGGSVSQLLGYRLFES